MRNLARILFTLIFFAVGILSGHQATAQSQVPTYADVQAEANKGGYKLIDIDELWKLYQQDGDNLLLIDTRQEWEYHAGYIKAALNFPMEPTWLARLTQRGAMEQFLGQDKTKTLVF